ncbi:metal-binding protein [Gloeobacter kilaueensis]|uniref:metal-binding protein n=1 Tax=Gloeobacter kilaueensis TaxID=1416614 RepID=UPI003B84763E
MVAAWALTGSLRIAATVGVSYVFAGLMFGGDLDIHSIQYRRWGPLRWLWLPYRRLGTHRSWFTHGPIAGTLGRLVYLGIALACLGLPLAFVLEDWGDVPLHWRAHLLAAFSWGSAHWPVLVWGLLGLELGAMSHSLSDWMGSACRRLLRARRRRRQGASPYRISAARGR